MNDVLEALRKAAALPYGGKPARFQVMFSQRLIEKNFFDPAWKWRNEMVPEIKCLTGEEGYFPDLYEAFVDHKLQAEVICMLMQPYATGVLDWETRSWVTLHKS
jgi:hypothetical protein